MSEIDKEYEDAQNFLAKHHVRLALHGEEYREMGKVINLLTRLYEEWQDRGKKVEQAWAERQFLYSHIDQLKQRIAELERREVKK